MEAARNRRASFHGARHALKVMPSSSMARTLAGQAIEHRKSALAKLIRGVLDGVAFNQHFTCDGATSFSK